MPDPAVPCRGGIASDLAVLASHAAGVRRMSGSRATRRPAGLGGSNAVPRGIPHYAERSRLLPNPEVNRI